MNKVLVRCWEVKNRQSKKIASHTLIVTYPEGHLGHDLITCLSCGEVYAVTIAKETYIGPELKVKLKTIACVECGKILENNHAYYPDLYIYDGKIYKYKKSLEIPSDSKAVIKKIYGIYD